MNEVQININEIKSENFQYDINTIKFKNLAQLIFERVVCYFKGHAYQEHIIRNDIEIDMCNRCGKKKVYDL